ncbi:MAG: DNA methyltransferase [Chloroflexota bacterium]
MRAFSDFWHWDEAALKTYHALVTQSPLNVSKMIEALCNFIGRNDMTAYLVMMATRLIELHRVLKPTGCIYLHCDPTASHYLKVVMDTIFGAKNFRNEIPWRRSNAHNKLSRQYGPIHDTLLFYSKSENMVFHTPRRPHFKQYVEEMFRYQDEHGRFRINELTGSGIRYGHSGKPWRGYDPTPRGRHWAVSARLLGEIGDTSLTSQDMLDELDRRGLILHPKGPGGLPRYRQYLQDEDGVLLQDIWAYQPYSQGMLYGTKEGVDEDVKWLDAEEEKLGYQTQKPLGLLERIVRASSNPSDIVLDPFCGCGTAVVAAQKLGRQWIGIDVTHLAIAVMRKRLQDSFPGLKFEVIGEPVDLEGARALARQDRYQFQWWALSLIGAMPVADDRKKGADKGIDGVTTFMDAHGGKSARAIVQVKSGHVSSAQVRDLKGVMEREKAAIGIFITLEPPTRDMNTEAIAAGFHHSELWQRDFRRLQIPTIEELLAGKGPDIPGLMSPYAQAQRVKPHEGQQLQLESRRGSKETLER